MFFPLICSNIFWFWFWWMLERNALNKYINLQIDSLYGAYRGQTKIRCGRRRHENARLKIHHFIGFMTADRFVLTAVAATFCPTGFLRFLFSEMTLVIF